MTKELLSREMVAKCWLSIIIPTYNGEKFLPTALAAVERQNLAGVEIIVIDDGSTDGSIEIVSDFAKRLPIRLVANARRGNWVASTNEGVRMARGEWITFLHQDDGWAPDRLSKLRQTILQNPMVHFVVHDAWFADRDGSSVGAYSSALPAGRALSAQEALAPLFVQNTIAISCVAFRREVFLRVGGMDEDRRYTADWKLWLSLAAQGETFRIGESLGFFRIHLGSQTSAMSRSPETFLSEQRYVQAHFAELLSTTVGGASKYLDAGRLSSYGNVILAAAWDRKFRTCRNLLGELGVPSLETTRIFLRHARLGQRIRSRLWSFAAKRHVWRGSGALST